MRGRPLLGALLAVALALTACASPAAPTPTPPKPASTAAAAPSAPTKSAEPTKPAAPTATTAPVATATPKPVTLKFGSVQSIADAGVWVAMEKGYFKEQGITLELNNFRTVAEVIAPLGAGQVEVGATPISSALLAAADRGIELKITADKTQLLPKWEISWIVLRKDLADSGKVKTAADLKGMKLAIPSQGSIGDEAIQTMLEQAGVKLEEVEVVVLPFTDMASAFGNKAIAAAFSTEPYTAQGLQQGFAIKWIPITQIFGGRFQTSTIIYGSALLKDQDLGRRWMIAYLKGVRDYMKSFTGNEGRADVINILVKYGAVKDLKMYDLMEMPYLDPNGLPDKKSMDVQYKWLVDKGLYTGKKTFDDITDLSFANYASQKLGKQ